MDPAKRERPRASSVRPAARVLACCALLFASHVSAQAASPTSLRLTSALEVGNGRMPLLPPDGIAKPKARESLLLGARVSIDVGVAPHLALEAALAVHGYVMPGFTVTELHVAPRVRWIVGRNEWYLRPVAGVGFARHVVGATGLVGGLGVGMRRALSARVDVFVELGYRFRYFHHVESAFATATWPGFGDHPDVAPHALACFLGLTSGVGFDLR